MKSAALTAITFLTTACLAHAIIETAAVFSEVDNAYAADVSGGDLVNKDQASLTSFTSSVAPAFGAGGQNDGAYGLANSAAAAWYHPPASLPATLTFELNVAAHPAGYEISAIRSFAGWRDGGTQTYANQKYTVEYRAVGSGDWVLLATVDYSPFTNAASNTPANTKVSLAAPSGLLATGVAALRFLLVVPSQSGGTNNGTLLQEIDVVGQAVGTLPQSVTLTSPPARTVVQRSTGNLGSIPISGNYSGAPGSIEARAVVMAGAGNSGTTTAWQTIVATPAGGTFAGTLSGIPAGGWYQIEVRSVAGGVPGQEAGVARIGVGDIFVTAGQSNSTNYGSPQYTPTDDRVCVRTGLTGSSWRHGYDPLPAPDGSGGGSVWSRLGDKLAATDNIPIGFICAGWGGTATSQWLPGTSLYNNLKAALQSFPSGGFRAVLWHQGESDSIAGVTAATHAARLAAIIAQSRTDAGWSVPWYLAEVSFHPASNLSQEEPVTAGQRAAVYADPLVLLGPSTDAFHLEGKLSDGVHFNAAGLADHSDQWRDVLRGTTAPTPRNGGFEDNRTAAVTGLAPLADGASHIVNISSDNNSPSVLGWRILTADGLHAAAGSNGFFNPTTGTYAGAIDTANGGVLPHMAGRHVAFLDGGAAGNYFLHTTRAIVQPGTRYTLTVAIGIRDIPATFGTARLDLLADGQVVATATFDKAALDSLHGSDASGSFTDVSLSYVADASATPNQPLAIRIAKVAGAATVLDFDNVRLTATPLRGRLSDLVLSTGTLSPLFTSTTTDYTASVSNGTAWITVTPTAAQANATVTVNGVAVASGSPSGNIALSLGSNIITVVATPQDGVTDLIYTVNVKRQSLPPTVTLIGPGNGASFTLPTIIGLVANASDPDDPIAKIEFLDGAVVIGEVTTPPYAFAWSSATMGSHTITARATDNSSAVTTSAGATITVTGNGVGGNGTGWSAQYYKDASGTSHLVDPPFATRADPTIYFCTVFGWPNNLVANVATTPGATKFSVRWSGKLLVPSTATYNFHTLADDGVRLYVNGQLVINNWADHTVTSNVGSIALSAGQFNDVVLEYYQNTGNGLVILEYEAPAAGVWRQVIPTSRLYPALIPSIINHPSPVTLTNSNAAVFSTFAIGAATLGYQWQFNGADLPGATSPSLTLENPLLSQAGNYRVRVSNSHGTVTSNQAALIIPDSDNDGIPDYWENQFGLHSALAPEAAGSGDTDGDGFSDKAEFLAATNPTLSTSLLTLDMRMNAQPGAGVTLSFTAQGNRSYSLQYTDSLAPASWTTLQQIPAASGARVLEFADPAAGHNHRYYRVITPQQ